MISHALCQSISHAFSGLAPPPSPRTLLINSFAGRPPSSGRCCWLSPSIVYLSNRLSRVAAVILQTPAFAAAASLKKATPAPGCACDGIKYTLSVPVIKAFDLRHSDSFSALLVLQDFITLANFAYDEKDMNICCTP
ncbi:hypothetical protein GUJ93_ZPchr0006g41138 [Zizania palustris]|uniref:Uncharacterized protein n=1 Tax=Zizania palustris TaxID=103762 RepID=A0A8J5SHJ4_ZIZPA|nr:hypothetical protein GUJ93_ZPchr0006g41138 [Zizania palustris]